jgi:fatty-acyl-CoA synthase
MVALWAATVVGAADPLNLLFTREAIAAQLTAAGAKILLVPPPGAPGGLFEKVAGLQREVPTLERIVVLPIDGTVAFDGEVLRPDINWQSGLGSADADPGSANAGEADRVAALLPTGGTTGHPKIVRLTNRNMVASSVGSMLASGMTPSDRVMVALPLFHVGGAFCGCLPALAAGASVYFPTAFGMRNPEVVTHFWRIIERCRITFTGVVPTSLGAVASVAVDGADLSTLRLVATGASTCPPEIERRFLATWGGDAVRQIYGMTEFCGAITQVPYDKSPDGVAVGLPVALADVAVLADGRIHREAGSVGELLVRGPQVFAGYVDARQTARAFHEGWLRSGDLCRIETSGQVVVTGRIKDLIIRGGHNIDPAQIEEAAMQFPAVALAAAVGRPDGYAGEVPMLFVASHPGKTIDVAALADFIAERIAEPVARPKAILLVDDIPLTPVGKIFKPRLREIAAEQAVLQMLSEQAGSAGFAVQAVTDAERGLVVKVVSGNDANSHATIKKLLEQLPLAIEISSTAPWQAPR